MIRHILLLLTGLAFFSCSKDELVTIPGNKAPKDTTVEIVRIENYINRTFILTLGREPDSIEFSFSRSTLINNHLSYAARASFLAAIFNATDYLPHEYEENKINLLNDIDTSDFSFWIQVFDNALLDSSNQFFWQTISYERNRMLLMRDAFSEFVNGSINNSELQKRMCNNYLYDKLNMGSANFVNYTFQNLLKRSATTAELSNGISMVEGNNAILFLESGSSKNDFLRILCDSPSYYEGQLILLYERYLSRTPSTLEMADGALLYQSSASFIEVAKSILSTDEFIGIQ